MTKSPGVVENLFQLRLAPRPELLLLINLLILHGVELRIGRSSDDSMKIREVKDHCEFANVICFFPSM